MWREFSLLQRRSSCGRHIDVATAPNIFCSWSLLVAWNLRKNLSNLFGSWFFSHAPRTKQGLLIKGTESDSLAVSKGFWAKKKYFNKYTSINNKCRDCTSQNFAQTYVGLLARSGCLEQGQVETLMSLFCRHFSKRRDSVLPNCNVALIKQQRGDAVWCGFYFFYLLIFLGRCISGKFFLSD